MTDRPRWPVVGGALVGGGLGAVGVGSLLGNARDTHPAVVVRWVIGLAILHDLVLVPVVLVIGLAVRRWAPGRALVAGALLVSSSVAIVALPLVLGYGRQAGNPSLLPRDYGRGLAVVLAAVWLATAGLGLVARWRHNKVPAMAEDV